MTGSEPKDLKVNLKKIRDEENLKARIAADIEKAHIERQISEAARLDAEKKASTVRGPGGEESTLWKEAIREADRAISLENVMSYNDWRAAMMSLVAMYSGLADAISQSRVEATAHFVSFVKNGAVYPFYDNKLRQFFTKTPEEVLPPLQHHVSCKPNGEINFKEMELDTSTGSKLEGRLDAIFQKGIIAWLDHCGYVPEEENSSKFISKEDNSAMTQADFNRLKTDPVNGLDKFLSGHFELEINERPSGPSPTA